MSLDGGNKAIAPVYVAAVRDVRYHSVACLTFLIWHCFLTLDQDVQYIWTMRNNNPLKWVYFFLRYVVVLACVMHNWLVARLADDSNPPLLCTIWHVYVPVFAQILINLLELILATRILALYNRSRRIAFLLSILIFMEFAGTMRMLWLQKSLTFYQTCLLTQLTKTGRDQSILVFIIHCVLISLTLFKYFVAFKEGRKRIPVVFLVVRDGTILYATVFFILLSLFIVYDFKNERETAIFFWVVSLFSISGCLMILSMERFARREISTEYPQTIFTSQFILGTFESGTQDRFAPSESSLGPGDSLA